jgi:hypothetical protein
VKAKREKTNLDTAITAEKMGIGVAKVSVHPIMELMKNANALAMKGKWKMASKYDLAMNAIAESLAPPISPRLPGPPPSVAWLVGQAIGLEMRVVKNHRLHCKMSEEAWNASYAQVKK